ncbi:unnamed protein product [Amoebophrya sp. A120]|nr:unnamed protein product [Amoebophrya sp. A120]|eukprot:GSA120T00009641001.1
MLTRSNLSPSGERQNDRSGMVLVVKPYGRERCSVCAAGLLLATLLCFLGNPSANFWASGRIGDKRKKDIVINAAVGQEEPDGEQADFAQEDEEQAALGPEEVQPEPQFFHLRSAKKSSGFSSFPSLVSTSDMTSSLVQRADFPRHLPCLTGDCLPQNSIQGYGLPGRVENHAGSTSTAPPISFTARTVRRPGADVEDMRLSTQVTTMDFRGTQHWDVPVGGKDYVVVHVTRDKAGGEISETWSHLPRFRLPHELFNHQHWQSAVQKGVRWFGIYGLNKTEEDVDLREVVIWHSEAGGRECKEQPHQVFMGYIQPNGPPPCTQPSMEPIPSAWSTLLGSETNSATNAHDGKPRSEGNHMELKYENKTIKDGLIKMDILNFTVLTVSEGDNFDWGLRRNHWAHLRGFELPEAFQQQDVVTSAETQHPGRYIWFGVWSPFFPGLDELEPAMREFTGQYELVVMWHNIKDGTECIDFRTEPRYSDPCDTETARPIPESWTRGFAFEPIQFVNDTVLAALEAEMRPPGQKKPWVYTNETVRWYGKTDYVTTTEWEGDNYGWGHRRTWWAHLPTFQFPKSVDRQEVQGFREKNGGAVWLGLRAHFGGTRDNTLLEVRRPADTMVIIWHNEATGAECVEFDRESKYGGPCLSPRARPIPSSWKKEASGVSFSQKASRDSTTSFQLNPPSPSLLRGGKTTASVSFVQEEKTGRKKEQQGYSSGSTSCGSSGEDVSSPRSSSSFAQLQQGTTTLSDAESAAQQLEALQDVREQAHQKGFTVDKDGHVSALASGGSSNGVPDLDYFPIPIDRRYYQFEQIESRIAEEKLEQERADRLVEQSLVHGGVAEQSRSTDDSSSSSSSSSSAHDEQDGAGHSPVAAPLQGSWTTTTRNTPCGCFTAENCFGCQHSTWNSLPQDDSFPSYDSDDGYVSDIGHRPGVPVYLAGRSKGPSSRSSGLGGAISSFGGRR